MSVFTDALDDNLQVQDTWGRTKYVSSMSQRFALAASIKVRENANLTQHMTIRESRLQYSYIANVVVAQALKMSGVPTNSMRYRPTLVQMMRITSRLSRAFPVTILQHMTTHDALKVAYAVLVMQRMRIKGSPSVTARYGLMLQQMMRITALASYGFGGGLAQAMTIHDAFTPQWKFVRALSDGLTIGASMTGYLVFQVTLAEGLEVEDSQLLRAIYTGKLQDGVVITGGLVDPGGGYTAWAINTRTEAVTEYQNFEYNSFAQLGRRYIGANAQGVWALDGPTDDGVSIQSDVKGGFMQMGGSHFTQFSAIYLGFRTDTNSDNWFLKLHTPGGLVYTYNVMPRDLATTKVNIGKGLRSRYISWELVTPGPEFDLSSIEFVPIISKRRV